MYKRANSIMAVNITYNFPLFEAGKPKREWKQFGFVSINHRACIKSLDRGCTLLKISHVFVIKRHLGNAFFSPKYVYEEEKCD